MLFRRNTYNPARHVQDSLESELSSSDSTRRCIGEEVRKLFTWLIPTVHLRENDPLR